MPEHRERALLDPMGVILIIVQLIIVTVIITSLPNGTKTRKLLKPALVKVQADQFYTTGGGHIVSLYHNQGDHVFMNITSPTDRVSIISLSLISPFRCDIIARKTDSNEPEGRAAWQYLCIYQTGAVMVFLTPHRQNSPISPRRPGK
ncbi:MAG: hypothetical protein WCF90_09115 [Methanomicrobiales archaeon]